jgi:hypothetical protein
MLVLAILGGCAETRVSPTGFYAWPVSLQTQGSAYVALTPDGKYQGDVYAGSGYMTARIVASAFAPFLSKVTSGVEVEDFEQAIATAKRRGFTYLLYPMIRHWEDRATEWSMKPDRVAIELSVVLVGPERVLDSVVIEGKSTLATFGGDHPQDLLPEPVGEYAASLFK